MVKWDARKIITNGKTQLNENQSCIKGLMSIIVLSIKNVGVLQKRLLQWGVKMRMSINIDMNVRE